MFPRSFFVLFCHYSILSYFPTRRSSDLEERGCFQSVNEFLGGRRPRSNQRAAHQARIPGWNVPKTDFGVVCSLFLIKQLYRAQLKIEWGAGVFSERK